MNGINSINTMDLMIALLKELELLIEDQAKQ